jgi:PAS domain S-box-containing protein
LLTPLLGGFFFGMRGWLTFVVITVTQAAFAVSWHMGGYALHLLEVPGAETAAGLAINVAGAAFVTAVIGVLERTRSFGRRQLDELTSELDGERQRLELLLANTSDLVALVDTEGRAVTCNPAAQRLVDAISGRPFRPGDQVSTLFDDATRLGWQERLDEVRGGEVVSSEDRLTVGDQELWIDVRMHPVIEQGQLRAVTVFARDVTARHQAEAAMRSLQDQLARAARLAGKAEVATDVLHSVGNALNSINVSVGELVDIARQLRPETLRKAADLVSAHADALAASMGSERGAKIPLLLAALAEAFARQKAHLLDEAKRLGSHVEHVNRVLAAQQKHARSVSILERVSVADLVQGALALEDGWQRRGIELAVEIAPMESVVVDKHRVIEILVNLLANARDALRSADRADKRVTIVAEPQGDHLAISVRDNGIGMTPEVRARLFQHGFTTKLDGHGFGLHSSALAAQEIGGRLRCDAQGPGAGAVFVLELPFEARGTEARGTEVRDVA